MPLSPSQLSDLSRLMSQYFDLGEIEGVCFDLGIDADEVSGANKSEKMRSLIQYCERHNQFDALLAKVKAERPHVAWPVSGAPGSGNQYNQSSHAESGGTATTINNIGATPQPGATTPPTTHRKITILFLAANPKDTDRLRLDKEVRTIEERLRQGQNRDTIVLQQQWAARTGDILDAMLRYKPDIVHFSGHGSPKGDLLFENAAGNAQPVPAEALGALFAARKHVRCVVMNACWSAKHAAAIAKAVDCVVGMSRSVSDDGATNFASGFYRSLGDGLSVEEAFELGKVQIMLDGGDDGSEEKRPKLNVKAGVDAAAVKFA